MRYFLILLLVLLINGACAEDIPPKVQALAKQIYGDTYNPNNVYKSRIPGLYEVISNGSVSYLDLERNVVFLGKVIQLSDYKDLTEERLKAYRHQFVQDFDDKQMISFTPKNYQHTIYVFTDVDCHYCRLFHKNIKSINQMGIRVNYLLTPYRGQDASARAEAVWCSKQRKELLTRAKQGKEIALRQCDNPIEDHLELAKLFGVSGTPAIVLSDGSLLRGFRKPDQLLQEVQAVKRQ